MWYIVPECKGGIALYTGLAKEPPADDDPTLNQLWVSVLCTCPVARLSIYPHTHRPDPPTILLINPPTYTTNNTYKKRAQYKSTFLTVKKVGLFSHQVMEKYK